MTWHPAWTGLAWFGLALLGLTAVTLLLARLARIDLGWLPVTAVLRAIVQLAVIAVLLQGILAAPWAVLAFVALMLTTASVTSAGRLDGLWRSRGAAVAGVVAGSAASLLAILALRLVELDARQVVAVAGIIVGNAMSAATLAGRNFLRLARSRRDEVEGWLALGARPAIAHRELTREAVRESMLPTLDQTRSTGLVTLPGAFVGALFGGASPLVAAQFQLVVLVGIALTMLLTGLVVTAIVSRTPYVVVEPHS